MPLQILISFLVAMKYGRLRVEVQHYSCHVGQHSPLLVSNNHGSLTCYLENLIQDQSDDEELDREFGAKGEENFGCFEN